MLLCSVLVWDSMQAGAWIFWSRVEAVEEMRAGWRRRLLGPVVSQVKRLVVFPPRPGDALTHGG